MIETVFVAGQFVNAKTQEPINGPVSLIPSRLWVDEFGVSYATLAPTVMTKNGKFRVPVTSCVKRDGDYGLFYMIKCPMGAWTIKPAGADGELVHLKDLLPRKYA